MTRQDRFEHSWAERHDVPVEAITKYRHESREGYRLPDLAAHYRTWCEALDSICFVCTDQPGPGYECKFVELEDGQGKSVQWHWHDRADGLSELRAKP